MTPRQIIAKRFQARLYALKLSQADRLAVSDRWIATLVAYRVLVHAQISRELTADEQADKARLERLVGIRAAIDGVEYDVRRR